MCLKKEIPLEMIEFDDEADYDAIAYMRFYYGTFYRRQNNNKKKTEKLLKTQPRYSFKIVHKMLKHQMNDRFARTFERTSKIMKINDANK